MYLSCIGTLPEDRVCFQLLIQNQDDDEKSVVINMDISGDQPSSEGAEFMHLHAVNMAMHLQT